MLQCITFVGNETCVVCIGCRNIIRSDGNFCSEGRETPLSPPPPSSSSVQTSPRGLGYTCGPIDGSLYAVVHQGAAGGARGSPLTVSMDSGISSAPPQRPSPPEPEPDNQAHGDLDKLLHDMMLTVEVTSLHPTTFKIFEKIIFHSRFYQNFFPSFLFSLPERNESC